jgi:NADH dehydrogenase
MPIFGVFGDGAYKLRPIHVDDMAELLITQAKGNHNATVDAVGPETFTYIELVRTLAIILQTRRPIVHLSQTLGYTISKLLNPFVRDVIITKEEIKGLMRGLLDSDQPATGTIKLTEWAMRHRETLGRRYASEVGRRTKRKLAYEHI